MKSVRFLLPLLLLLCTFSLCGCTSKEEKKIEDAVKQELDQLKNLDSVTTQKYISYQELFPGEPEDIAISSDIEEVFSLFFQDFDYKILDVNVDKDKQSAQANLRLVTLDAHALAEDFSKAQLKHEISQSASSEEATEQTISLEERYTLLNELLKSNDYQTVDDIFCNLPSIFNSFNFLIKTAIAVMTATAVMITLKYLFIPSPIQNSS